MKIRKHSQRHRILLPLCLITGSLLIQIDAKERPQRLQPEQEKREQEKKPDRGQEESGINTIKIPTELVQLDVSVTDKDNNPVTNLGKFDFTVYEDKVKQVIESVNYENVPLSLGIAIDTSGSMRPKYFTVKDAARTLIKELRFTDECFISQFKLEAEMVQSFTNDKRRLVKSLDDLYIGGGTSLLDAIVATTDYAHEKGARRRKAIIVISDGLEKNSANKEKQVLQAVKENEVQLYLIGFIDKDENKGFFSFSENKRAKRLLQRLADESGGRAFFPEAIDEMSAIAARISTELRSQYAVNYYPLNDKRDGTFRSVRVSVNSRENRKLIARTRQGYYARSEQ
jgi:Ca-activated chloride channel homolog